MGKPKVKFHSQDMEPGVLNSPPVLGWIQSTGLHAGWIQPRVQVNFGPVHVVVGMPVIPVPPHATCPTLKLELDLLPVTYVLFQGSSSACNSGIEHMAATALAPGPAWSRVAAGPGHDSGNRQSNCRKTGPVSAFTLTPATDCYAY